MAVWAADCRTDAVWAEYPNSSSRGATMRWLLFGLTLMLSTSVAAHAANLTPGEAAKHIGENATICGIVASARVLSELHLV